MLCKGPAASTIQLFNIAMYTPILFNSELIRIWIQNQIEPNRSPSTLFEMDDGSGHFTFTTNLLSKKNFV